MKLHQSTDLGSEKCWVPIGQSYSRCCRSATLPRSRARGSGTRVQKTWRKWKTWRREMANLQFQRLGKSAALPKDVLIQTVFEFVFLYGRVALYKTFPTCGCPGGQERKEAESRKSREVVGIYESRQASISSAYIQGIKSLQSESSYKCPKLLLKVFDVLSTKDSVGNGQMGNYGNLFRIWHDGLCAMLGLDYLDSSLTMSLAHCFQGICGIIASCGR